MQSNDARREFARMIHPSSNTQESELRVSNPFKPDAKGGGNVKIHDGDLTTVRTSHSGAATLGFKYLDHAGDQRSILITMDSADLDRIEHERIRPAKPAPFTRVSELSEKQWDKLARRHSLTLRWNVVVNCGYYFVPVQDRDDAPATFPTPGEAWKHAVIVYGVEALA